MPTVQFKGVASEAASSEDDALSGQGNQDARGGWMRESRPPRQLSPARGQPIGHLVESPKNPNVAPTGEHVVEGVNEPHWKRFLPYGKRSYQMEIGFSTVSPLVRRFGPEQRPGLRHTLDLAAHSAGCRIDLPEIAVLGARGVEPFVIGAEADAVNRLPAENSETDPQRGGVDGHQPGLAHGEQG